MKKSFSGVSVSMPKVFKREVEECMEAFIDFLKEVIIALVPELKLEESLSCTHMSRVPFRYQKVLQRVFLSEAVMRIKLRVLVFLRNAQKRMK